MRMTDAEVDQRQREFEVIASNKPDPCRAIATALIEYDDEAGVPLVAISAIVRISYSEIEKTLVLLEENGEVERIPPGSKWRITSYGRKAYLDQRFAAKMRKCLTCSEMFMSTHAGNRICVGCNESDDLSGLGDSSDA